MTTSYVYGEMNSSDISPIDQIASKEFVHGVLKAGALISLLENKKLNPINFFLCILKSKQYQEIFVQITSSSNLKDAILSLLYLYPSIVKSKITKAAIKQFHEKGGVIKS